MLLATPEDVVSAIAPEVIISAATDQQVIPRPTHQDIVSRAPEDQIVAARSRMGGANPLDHVLSVDWADLAVVTENDVVAWAAVEDVVAVAAEDDVVPFISDPPVDHVVAAEIRPVQHTFGQGSACFEGSPEPP